MTKWFNVRLACALLVLLAFAVHLPAQQPATNAAGAAASPTIGFVPDSPSGTSAAAATPDWATNDASTSTNSASTKKTSSDDIFVQIALAMVTNAISEFAAIKAKAEQGDSDAQFKLGNMYHDGKGVAQQDYSEALKWYRKAADQGNANAQFKLGLMCAEADGVLQNYAEAVKWYRKAAEQGIEGAQYNLGLMYSTGQGVPQDNAEADKWNRRAAEQGDEDAEFNLGVAYHNGDGVPRDEVEEYKWFNLAAAQGDKTAKKNLLSLEAIMTPDQIAEAQRLSREFTPRKESNSANSISSDNPMASGTGFFITDDGYLISNYHVVRDATRVRVVTSGGTVPAKVVQVDEANDIALLKADGKFAPLPIASSRTVKLGNTVATVGFPDTGLQGFSPKLAKGKSRHCPACRMTRAISRSVCRCSRGIRAGRWWMSAATWWASCRPS